MNSLEKVEVSTVLCRLLSHIIITKNLFLRLTFCLSLQKKESKYNPTAGHHVPRSIGALLIKIKTSVWGIGD
jgi:hypothetical protein